MATSKNSRWGWMSQAVASVESGLDRILAEDELPVQSPSPKPPATVHAAPLAPRGSSDISRADANKNNERLQARLAQAMAKKTPSRSQTPQPNDDITTDDKSSTVKGSTAKASVDEGPESDRALKAHSLPRVSVSDAASNNGSNRLSGDIVRQSMEATSSIPPSRTSSVQESRLSASKVDPDEDPRRLAMRLEHETAIAEMQEEINGYLERIDALQRNLQLLTKDTIQNAKAISTDNESTSQQKQSAEKDEKIALLIEEGSKLAKNELQFRNTIKKLRTQSTAMTKEQDILRLRLEKAERATSAMESRARKAESEMTLVKSQLAQSTKSSSDLDTITRERNALQSTLAEVRGQLSRANKRAEEAESRSQSTKVEAAHHRVTELEDSLSSIMVEQELERDKSQRTIDDLRQALTREKEQARVMETEMLAEQAALESKLEAFRVRAEEASAGDQNDSHAKLLRQIETLQSQHSVAGQNWQGIESTLLARITALEKERDEVTSHEADLRRKLRDATNRAKAAAKELEEERQVMSTLQEESDQYRNQQHDSRKQVSALEQQVASMHKAVERQKLNAEQEMLRRIEEERVKWMNSLPQSLPRVESPVASMRRGQGSSIMDTIQSPVDRPVSRRSSAHPFPESNFIHSRLNSTNSFKTNGMSPTVETPSIIVPEDQDDFFANVPATPASVTRADSGGRLNEMISASTAGAGPSVQLVERLSTTVRRLETEKAASKDEVARLSSQRDEARKEVVNLMREVEQTRAAGERLAELEKRHTELSNKHDKTLELLGEKSEQVEELKADIADVKEMYRHLADTMGK